MGGTSLQLASPWKSTALEDAEKLHFSGGRAFF